MSTLDPFLQSDGLALLRLLELAAAQTDSQDPGGSGSAARGRLVTNWLVAREWRAPHGLLEAADEYTPAATLRRLGGRGDQSETRWRLAAELARSRRR